MRLEALLTDVRERMKSAEYVEIDPRQMSEAMETTLWFLWYTNPGAVRPKTLEMAAELGLHFQPYMYPDGRTCVLFAPLDSPLARRTQRVRA